jgi:hypothetical protein
MTDAPFDWLNLTNYPNVLTERPSPIAAALRVATQLRAMPPPLPPLPRSTMANALLPPFSPQPPFDDPLREAAWAKTAGHVEAPSCRDEEGVTLYRNARPGEIGAWDKAHIVDGILGGVDHPSNLRALNEASNRRQGAHLGNALRGLR